MYICFMKKLITLTAFMFTLFAFGQFNFVNQGAEAVQINQSFIQYGDLEETSPVPANFGWQTTHSIEVQTSGAINGNDSFQGNQHFELLSREFGDNMYQRVTTIPTTTVTISFYHKKRRENGNDVMQVLAGSTLNTLEVIGEHEVLFDDGWVLVEFDYTIPNNQWSTIFMLKGIDGSLKSVGNLIDNVSLSSPSLSTNNPKQLDTSNLPFGEDYRVYDLTGKLLQRGTVHYNTYRSLPRHRPIFIIVEGYKPLRILKN
jgi:hypothetical protein